MKKILILLTFVVLFSIGCKKFLDINDTPNAISTATIEMVLPVGQSSVCYVVGGNYQILGGIWAQHWTAYPNAPQYQGIESYNVNVTTFDGRQWGELYTGALNDLEWVRNTAREDESWNYYLIATALQSYTYQVLVDLYDEIPFTEALQSIPPHYDNAETVYNGLIERIDEALDLYQNAGMVPVPGNEDIIFRGDMDSWEAFANTLKLKIYLRQTNIRSSVAQAGIQKMYSDGVTFLTVDAAMTDFLDQTNHMNPVYELEWARFGNNNICASSTCIDYLVSNNDPRIGGVNIEGDPIGFYVYSSGTDFAGMIQGDYRNTVSYPGNSDPDLSAPNVSSVNPVYLMTAAESNFLQAEACARGWGTDDAKAKYDAGIGNTNVSAGYALYPDGSLEANLEAIITQKWISMINKQGLEAFFEYNRTGYPDFFTVSITGVLSPPVEFPQRLLIPQSEIDRNPNTPAIKTVNTKVWWAK